MVVTARTQTQMAKRPYPPDTLDPRLRLRQFRIDDVDAMHACFANPEAMRFWNQPVHTKRIETERAVRNFIDCTPSYYRFWAVADAEPIAASGSSTTTMAISAVSGWHRLYRRPHPPRQGIATEAVSAMLDFCFGELGLHRAQAFIDPNNTASIALVEKLGFRREGLLRDNLRVGDVWRSDLLYALLVTERHRFRNSGTRAPCPVAAVSAVLCQHRPSLDKALLPLWEA